MKKRYSFFAVILIVATLLGSLAACKKLEEATTGVPDTDSTESESATTNNGSETGTEIETDLPIDECKDHKDAYYIIEAVAQNGRNGLANGWNYDNRFDLQNTSGRDESTLYDESDEKFYRFIRDFDAESNGSFRLEMLIKANSNEGGIYVALEDGKENRLFGLKVKNGKWTLSGSEEKETPVAIVQSNTVDYAIELNFDLDKQTMSAVINNVDCGSVKISASVISRLVLGTNKVGKGVLSMYYVRLSKNYAVNHHFLTNPDNIGQTPVDWTVTGDFKLANINSMRLYEMTSVKADSKAGSASTAIHTFDTVSGKVAFETMILLPKKVDGAVVSLMSGDTEAVKFETRDGKIYVGDQMVNDYIANVWQTLHIEANTESKTAEIYVNGKIKATIPLTVSFFNGIKITFAPKTDAVMWFDDVEVYNLYDHSDYPSEPQVAESKDYNIGMNVCWLWRDQQSGEGWDATSPFSEFDPYLGFYDEGLRETADWELKWMAEHGIDFAHVCWYCPSGDIQAPIKEMRHSYAALHDGYMMAEYSEYVDFCIMWENNGQDCKSFEQFKEYIWNYWMEYYFSDPRYVRLDNKAVLTVWNTTNFVNAFGGKAGAKKAVEFMEEELKKIGYDGIILLASTQGITSEESYRELSAIGFTASYGYHWSANGHSAEHQINCNAGCIENASSISHHIPTVSIGFNDVGRNESRDPIITGEEHLKVCQYIKEALAEFNTGTWKDNTLFLSTWNEFSEGTYILPTESIGFSFLENVRQTFTNDTSDHTKLDVKPTQNQLDRIGHLYPPNHSPIRWYQFEKSSDQIREDPTLTEFVSVKAYDMSEKASANAWKEGHGLSSYRVRNGAIMGKSSKSDFAIMSSDKFESFNAKDAPVLHIRMKNDQLANYEVFFITDSDSNWSSNKQKSAKITATGEFVDYYINMSTVSTWSGEIVGLRIDPQTAPGSFEITLIEFMNFPKVDETAIPSVMVNGVELDFTFDPEMLSDGDILVCGEAKKYGFYSALRLYHEWDRFTGEGVLTLYTFDEKKLVFTVGSDKVIIDGKKVDAGFTFTLRDGLPQFHIQKLCKLLGYKYTVNGNTIKIQAATDTEYEIMVNAVPNQWEFENNGVQEGWAGQNASLLAQDGFLVLTPSGSDVAVKHSVSFDADDYTHMILGMVYTPTTTSNAQLFFTTTSGTSYSADRCINARFDLSGKKEGDIVEAVFDLNLSSSFSGTITGIRIDPYTGMDEGKIAYIRFVNMEAEEKEEVHEWNFNSDGDKEGWEKQNIDDATFITKDGYLVGTGTNNDPAVKLNTTLKAENYTKLTVGIKYSANLVGKAGCVYFTTSASPAWDADKYTEAKYVIPADTKEGDTIEVTFDLSNCKLWNSIITGIRFDMFGVAESFAIDYIYLH